MFLFGWRHTYSFHKQPNVKGKGKDVPPSSTSSTVPPVHPAPGSVVVEPPSGTANANADLKQIQDIGAASIFGSEDFKVAINDVSELTLIHTQCTALSLTRT